MKRKLFFSGTGLLSCILATSLSAAFPDAMTPFMVDQTDKLAGGGDAPLSCRLAADSPDVPQELVVEYDDTDSKADGRAEFEIRINGKEFNYDGFRWPQKGRRYIVHYPLTERFLKDGAVEASFQPTGKDRTLIPIRNVGVIRKKTPDQDGKGMSDFSNWKGLDAQGVPQGVEFVYTEPDGPGGIGRDDSRLDLTEAYGFKLDYELKGDKPVVAKIFLFGDRTAPGEFKPDRWARSAEFTLAPGKRSIVIPFESFSGIESLLSAISAIKSFGFRIDGDPSALRLTGAKYLHGNSVHAYSYIRSIPCKGDSEVEYELELTNMEDAPQTVRLEIDRYGWEEMKATLSDSEIELAPNEKKIVKLKVFCPDLIPPGGKEKQTVLVRPSANPEAVQKVEFVTLREMTRPFTLRTKEGWDEIRENVKKYDWMREAAEAAIASARKWNPPPQPRVMLNEGGSPCLMRTPQEWNAMNAAYAWQLTREKEFAEKVRAYLLLLSHPERGYPYTRFAVHQWLPQEGHFMYHAAQCYDLTLDSGLYSDKDRKQIDHMFRLFADATEKGNRGPSGANWAVSNLTGGFFAAVVLQDLVRADHMIYGPSMLMDKFRSYTMSDGWWYECTISYNLWCGEMFTMAALAMEPFGYSLLTEKFPVNYSRFPDYLKEGTPEEERRITRDVEHGHSFRIRGNIQQPYITVKSMAEALLPFLDYRAVMFAMNDSTENFVGGGRFELAYFAFRDPRFAACIRSVGKRTDFVWGVPELPEGSDIGKGSAYADNAGAMMLRSTQKDPRQRIQAVMKYGTHGGYHGHYDVTQLLSLMRYGRSFYNPEMVWYSYAPFMYNFYVQTSVSKNMTTVDLKQQESEDSMRRLFHAGDLFQAGCVETTAAWSYPAYLGLRDSMHGVSTLSGRKPEHENRSMPKVDNPPYSRLTGFTEPILQRRLMVLTDDYLLLADYDASVEGKKHRFDHMFQVKGFLGLSADSVKPDGREDTLSADPLSAAVVVTDVERFKVAGTAKASFLTKFGPGADNRGTRISGEDGNLFMDLYFAWPNSERVLWRGLAPEEHGNHMRLFWTVKGDGRELTKGDVGSWVLGHGEIDVDLTGVKTLELQTAIHGHEGYDRVFWGDPIIHAADGTKIPLSTLSGKSVNVRENRFADKNLDYLGGPLRIAGKAFESSLAAEPDKTGLDNPAVRTYDISGLNAVRLTAVVGGDYPGGPIKDRRHSIGVMTDGAAAARYLTVIEPFETEGENQVASVQATSPNDVVVKLKDGREHRIAIRNLDGDGKTVKVSVQEFKDGKLVREDATK